MASQDLDELLGVIDRDRRDMSPAAQIAERVRQLIHEGRLQPGERLPGQPTLAKHYGVARETVKRALERLTYEGLLRTEQARGTYVTDA